jgi:heterotetrameric sarcosine oxidase gamma subunit
MLEHRAPLDQLSWAHDVRTIDARGLRVAAVADRGLLLLQGDPGDCRFQDAIRERIGVALPGPLTAAIHGEYALLWMAPAQFLLELPAAQAPIVQSALSARFGAALAAVADVSDAFACFDVSGADAPDILMTGCGLDLRPDVFAAGRVARTAFADLPAVIWKPGNPDSFRCLVDRGFAEHFWSWCSAHASLVLANRGAAGP